jgi:hypothetical protein
MLAKQLEYLGNALSAGIVLGARVPIVLTSRADTAETRIASCVIAALIAHAARDRQKPAELIGRRLARPVASLPGAPWRVRRRRRSLPDAWFRPSPLPAGEPEKKFRPSCAQDRDFTAFPVPATGVG